MRLLSLRERLRQLGERWFINEPLLFSIWAMHTLQERGDIETIRSGEGRIEYNAAYLNRFDDSTLEQIMRCETVRLLLQHPYLRRMEIASLSYLASHITLKEHLNTPLPLPTAAEQFGHHRYDRQYFEFYYQKLVVEHSQSSSPLAGAAEASGQSEAGDGNENKNKTDADRKADPKVPEHLCDTPMNIAVQNSALWGENDLFQQQIQQQIRDAELNQSWGSLTHSLKSQIQATLKPRFNFRAVLKGFRATVLSNRRVLTRMRPNRRYDFLYPGSRREYSTRLLFAMDVSGSVSDQELNWALSTLNQIFHYGIEQLDLITFDVAVQDCWFGLKRAQPQLSIQGRGGTSFQAVIDYLDKSSPPYDGVIIFTDGYAPLPSAPRHPTRLLWLFNSGSSYRSMAGSLRALGQVAVVEAI